MKDVQTAVVAVCVGLALAYTAWRAWCQLRALWSAGRSDPSAAPGNAPPSCGPGPARGGCAGCSGCGSGGR